MTKNWNLPKYENARLGDFNDPQMTSKIMTWHDLHPLQYSPESNFRCVFPGFEEFATLVKRKQDKFHRLDIDQGNLIEGCILKLERDSCYIKVFGQKIGFQHSMFQSLVSYFYEYNCACCRGKADQGHGWTSVCWTADVEGRFVEVSCGWKINKNK